MSLSQGQTLFALKTILEWSIGIECLLQPLRQKSRKKHIEVRLTHTLQDGRHCVLAHCELVTQLQQVLIL